MQSRFALALPFVATCAGVIAGCASGAAPGTDPDARTIVDLLDAAVEPADSAPLGRVDAELGTPDAQPRPDAAPPPDAPPPPPPDAAPPDAPPGTPDAAPPIDAAPPDAAPACTSMWINVLTNASFDLGTTGWTESSSGGYAIIGPPPTGVTAHTTPNIAWLGGYDGALETVTQTVAIPADATMLRLGGFRIIGTDEIGTFPYDYLRIQLRTVAGALLETLAEWSNVDAVGAWTAFNATAASSHAGATLQFYVEMVTDPWPMSGTGALLDTLSLEAYVCR